MRIILLTVILLLGGLTGAATPARADGTIPSWLNEAKLGLETHDSYIAQDRDKLLHIWEMRKEPGLDANVELLFNGPDFLHYIGTPRIQLGANISLAGETDYAYTGLDWKHVFNNGLFLEGNFGFAIHDGTTDKKQTDAAGNITDASNAEYQRTKQFGSRVLFHFGPEFGYQFDRHNSLSFAWTHISNGEILDRSDSNANEGEDNFGFRYGYAF